LYVETVRT